MFKYRKKSTDDKTYEYVSPVWAFQSKFRGSIETKEGKTFYEAGDYIVYNEKPISVVDVELHKTDRYTVSKEKFESMYERVD